jgi:DNA-binding transcriptional ArsR family regulator
MKATMTLSNPEAFQLLADATRRKIVFLLRVKEMTVNRLAAELGLTPQTVYFHVKKLVKGGMVEVVREERTGHLIESYYMATAESFSFILGKGGLGSAHSRKLALEQEKMVLDALVKLGFKLKYDDQTVARLVDLMAEEKQCGSEKLDEKASSLGLDVVTQMMVMDHACVLSATEAEFRKANEVKHKFRETLLSLTK